MIVKSNQEVKKLDYYGFEKVNYLTVTTPDIEYSWCYSYLDLQDRLNELCKNHTLKKVYVNLISYAESYSQDINYYSFSYLGGPAILIFDNVAIEFCIHGVGLVKYREMNPWDVKVRKSYDLPPDDEYIFDRYFYDLGKQFELQYEKEQVNKVIVDRTDYYAFDVNGFDEERVQASEKANILPKGMHFRLANGVDFAVCADEIEYFYIELNLYSE
jgi:hypothetical protein